MQIKQLSQSKASSPPSSTPDWVVRIDILRSLRLHKMLASLIALATIGLGIAAKARHHATYEASSVVYVSPNFPATLAASQEQEYPYDSYVEEQVHSVTQYNVLSQALRKLKPGVWQFPGEAQGSAVDRLQRLLTVKRDGLSYQVLISLKGSNPNNLAEIVNAVTDSYIEETKNEEFYGRDKRLESLRQARAEVQDELTNKLREQTGITQALGLAVVSSEGGDQMDSQIGELRTEFATVHQQRIQAEAQLASLEDHAPGTPNPALNAAADEIIASDPSLLALKASLSQKKAVLLDQLAGLTPNHPLRKTTEEQLSEIENALQRMQADLRAHAAANLQQKLRTDLIRANAVEVKLLSELQSNTNQATHAAPSFQRAQVLDKEITALQARYITLDERTRNLELESKSPGSVHVFSPARVPTGPLPSKASFILPLLLPVALLLATGTVVLIDFFDRVIHNPIDVEQALGFYPIGTLFNDQEVTMQLFEEGTLRLAGGVDHAARTANVRTIVLTSVSAGAGTSSIVENLGNTLAKLGRRTLAIDSSGATAPVAYVTINIEQPVHLGVGGVSSRRPDVETCSTAVITQPFSPKLTPVINFADQAFKDLTTGYDIVLIDAPPILISAETEYLTRFADLTILIVEAENTTKAQLIRTARLLERLQIPGMGVIINKISTNRVNRATLEDLNAFEARMGSGNVSWTSSRSKVGTSGSNGEREQVAEENSTYA
jgi:succinoglycan biosynthesis transport protein ExoP